MTIHAFIFCFAFVFMLSLKPRPFVQSRPSICKRPDSYSCFFFFFWRCRFFRVFFCIISAFSSYVWRVRRAFFPYEWCLSTLWPRAGFFTSAYYVRIQSIKNILSEALPVFQNLNYNLQRRRSAYLQSMDFQREPQSKHHLYFLIVFFLPLDQPVPNPTHIANAHPDPHPS